MRRDKSRRERSQRGRSRGRRRTPTTVRVLSIALLVTVLVVGLLFGAVGAPTGAFEIGTTDRLASIDVVSDSSGLQRLDVTTALESGSENCLLTVTNQFGQDLTVTVSLREGSTGYGTLNVSIDGESGDAVEFPLAAGATRTVDMAVDSGTAENTTRFDVTADGTGIDASLPNRHAPIEATAGTICE